MHQRAADAGAEGDAEDVAVADARAEPALRERGGVRVVVDHDRHADPLHQRGAQRLVAPGQVRREQHGRRGRRRRTRPHRCRPPRRRTAALRVSTSSTMVSSTARHAAAGRRAAPAGQHGAEGVDDAGEHLGAADVDADGQRTGAPDHRATGAVAVGLGHARDTTARRVILRPCAPLRRTRRRRPHDPGHRAGRHPRPGLRRDREGAAPAERLGCNAGPVDGTRRHLDPDRDDPLPGRQPAGAERLAERRHPEPGCTPRRRCAAPPGPSPAPAPAGGS